MQLAVDIGNTRTKAGLFQGAELVSTEVRTDEPVYIIKDFYERNPQISAIIISSVNQKIEADLIPIPETIHHVILDENTPVPIDNLYDDKATLGRDRLAGVVAAASIFPGQNCVVIDAGTCITYDVIDREGRYHGGMISPGLQMRFNALHYGTARLPFIQADAMELPMLEGKSTKGSMESGVLWGMMHEINGNIASFSDKYDSLQVVLTGGNISLFESGIKSTIFADANFVLRGLQQILQYNLPNL